MAWDLLTTVYRLPEDKLYVTYFGGNKDLNLAPDFESKEIWGKLGYVGILSFIWSKLRGIFILVHCYLPGNLH